MISQELLEILVCPACKTKVVQDEEMLVCSGCGRRYPIRDGIPVMLIEEGDKLRVPIKPE
ncbi:MAG TPA: Trm112 family protein [Chloroflexota bacterium]|nr:Trm112 family protein [Chloroflexota bacterium]